MSRGLSSQDQLVVRVEGIAQPVRLVRRAGARGLTLRTDIVRQEVRVSLPVRAPVRQALALVARHRDWIAERFAAAPAHVPLTPGATFAFCGEPHELLWDPACGRQVLLADGLARVGGPEAGVERRLVRHLRAEALALMSGDARHYALRAGVAAPVLKLSDPRSRWGSCSSGGVLRLSWRLVMAPPWVRRAVVAHEVAHLVHMNHGPQFHALLASLYEGEVSAADCWLARHGAGLQMIARSALAA